MKWAHSQKGAPFSGLHYTQIISTLLLQRPYAQFEPRSCSNTNLRVNVVRQGPLTCSAALSPCAPGKPWYATRCRQAAGASSCACRAALLVTCCTAMHSSTVLDKEAGACALVSSFCC